MVPPHTASDENRRINIANGVALSDGTLAYAAGDANAGVNPNVVEAADTNNDNNPATALVSTANPNAGLLNTVGALGVDTDQFLGFDIFTDLGGLNQAFASLRVGGVQGLCTASTWAPALPPCWMRSASTACMASPSPRPSPPCPSLARWPWWLWLAWPS